MEEQIISIEIRTKGEKCEMSDAEIAAWYRTNVLGLFDPKYGTPAIDVQVKRVFSED